MDRRFSGKKSKTQTHDYEEPDRMTEEELREIVRDTVRKVGLGKTLKLKHVTDHPSFDTTGWTKNGVSEIVKDEINYINYCLEHSFKGKPTGEEYESDVSDAKSVGSKVSESEYETEEEPEEEEEEEDSDDDEDSDESDEEDEGSDEEEDEDEGSDDEEEGSDEEEEGSDSDEEENDLELYTYGKGLLLKGSTKDIKNALLKMGGRWNRSLGGWIFSPKKKDLLMETFEPEEKGPFKK